MSNDQRWHTWLAHARQQGLLPPAAQTASPPPDSPSWAVLVLSLFGAWLALLPLLGLFFLLLGSDAMRTPGAWVMALANVAISIALLRGQRGIFLQQIGISALVLGQVFWLLGWSDGFSENDPWVWSWALGSWVLVLAAMARIVATPWVVRLLGCMMAANIAVLPWWPRGSTLASWVQWLQWPSAALLACAWAAWVLCEARTLGRPWAAKLSTLADGWVVGLLLAWVGSGNTWWMLLNAASGGMGDGMLDAPDAALPWRTLLLPLAGVAAAALCLRHQGRGRITGGSWYLLAWVYAALALASLGWHHVGWWALVATAALVSQRWRVLTAALAVLVWQLAHFYYALHWPLIDKAWLLAAIGALLALAVGSSLWFNRTADAPVAAPAPPSTGLQRWGAGAGIAAMAVLALALIHSDVQRKETVIAQGQKIFLPLQPRDPRSLMQGDYMALRFPMPAAIETALQAEVWRSRAWALAQLDAQGKATLLALAEPGQATAPDQVLLPLKRLKGHWVVVTDAFFFPEGQGKPLAAARFGEFRVLPSGQALLVGLADAALQPIHAAPQPLLPAATE